MAGGSATRIYNNTLAAATVDQVLLAGFSRFVLVENLGAAPIFVTTLGHSTNDTRTLADPTVGANEEFEVPANQSLVVPVQHSWPSADAVNASNQPLWPLNQTVVKLISTGTSAYSVALN